MTRYVKKLNLFYCLVCGKKINKWARVNAKFCIDNERCRKRYHDVLKRPHMNRKALKEMSNNV